MKEKDRKIDFEEVVNSMKEIVEETNGGSATFSFKTSDNWLISLSVQAPEQPNV